MSFDLLAHTRAHIDPTYYARGSSYYQNGMVTIDDIDFMSDAMTTLYGEVQGTRLYETAIGIMYHAKTGLHIEYQCDCPAYHDHLECKHCAAFAMAVADRYMISDRGVVTER